jgi:hypothetical protein
MMFGFCAGFATYLVIMSGLWLQDAAVGTKAPSVYTSFLLLLLTDCRLVQLTACLCDCHLSACRMHVCMEDLLADEQLISLLQDLLLLSDRAKLADLPALAATSG